MKCQRCREFLRGRCVAGYEYPATRSEADKIAGETGVDTICPHSQFRQEIVRKVNRMFNNPCLGRIML